MIKPPLILTLSMDEKAFSFFNSLRRQYFPAAKNFIDAHLTLFHALPNDGLVVDAVRSLCRQQSPFLCRVIKPVSIGKGVAYKIESDELLQLHNILQQQWIAYLSVQDKQKLLPHITVQNKVAAEEARNLLAELQNAFESFDITALGLRLWEYLHGPWKLMEEYKFKVAAV